MLINKSCSCLSFLPRNSLVQFPRISIYNISSLASISTSTCDISIRKRSRDNVYAWNARPLKETNKVIGSRLHNSRFRGAKDGEPFAFRDLRSFRHSPAQFLFVILIVVVKKKILLLKSDCRKRNIRRRNKGTS